MILLFAILAALLLAALPTLLFLANLRQYRPPPPPDRDSPCISLLIPARNEEPSIAAALEAALASRYVELEVVVLDDHSTDATATIVQQFADRDDRVRLVSAPELPEGWCGKQHACWVLSQQATQDVLVFVDADVRLTPDGLARMAAFLERSGADLVSGIPHQETGTLGEKLVLPLIHFILLGFLPLKRMRASSDPAFAAGCGQLFVARRSSYEKMGGHAAIRTTLHDGLKLPRAFRAAGLRTDLCDATDVATCRMYRGFGELWHGLAKNATEGLGAPRLIVPATLLLFGGQVLPVVLLALSFGQGASLMGFAAAAVVVSCLPRWMGVLRFRQSRLGALLHPVGVVILLTIQWYALARRILGRPSGWKGREYAQVSARSDPGLQE